MYDLDSSDVLILDLLQTDVTLTVKEISEKVGLSTNACWNRIRRFEEKGLIKKRVALLNAKELGMKTTVFVSIKAAEHSAAWIDKFTKVITEMPEVVGFYRLAGDVDYLVKMLVIDLDHYDEVYRLLIEKVKLTEVSAAFAIQEIKNTTEIPLLRPHPPVYRGKKK